MIESDDYGDSDDEALLFAATQADVSQAPGGFEVSPRPSKRRKTNSDHGSNAGEDEPDDEEPLGGDGVEEVEDEPAKKPKYLMHAPKVNANMDRVVLTQTQHVLAPSQPWMIRGPIWRKPKPVKAPVLRNKAVTFQTMTKGSEDAAPRQDSDDDGDTEVSIARYAPKLGGKTSRIQL
jgi:ATP-dependent DNA helicase MPH1